MNVCMRVPCYMDTAGNCSACSPRPYYAPNPDPLRQPQPQYGWPIPPVGCICPPTSEQTCENPGCPRKNHLKAAGPIASPVKGGAA